MTSVLRQDAKITTDQIVQLVTAFAHNRPILDAAKNAGVHRDTARDIYGELRLRLTQPRFTKWVNSEYKEMLVPEDERIEVLARARDVLFQCHENRECKKRYRAGRHKYLTCRPCPIRDFAHWDENPHTDSQTSDTEDMVNMVFNIQDFYANLGWKESVKSGASAREVFDLRLRHFEVHNMALTLSTFDKRDDRNKSDGDDFLSMPYLKNELLEELKEKPLVAN